MEMVANITPRIRLLSSAGLMDLDLGSKWLVRKMVQHMVEYMNYVIGFIGKAGFNGPKVLEHDRMM